MLLTLEAMKKVDKGQITILVDTDTSKENVLRVAASQGWQEGRVLRQSHAGYPASIFHHIPQALCEALKKQESVHEQA